MNPPVPETAPSRKEVSRRDDVPSPVLYDGSQAGNPTSARRSSGGGLSSSPRLVRALLFFVLQICGPFTTIVVASETGATCFSVLGMLWFVFGWIPSFWIVHYMVPIFISHIRCPGCFEEYEAFDVWKCSCGYQDHKQRHMLWFHCPLCRKWLSRMDCRRCGATILIR